MKTLGWWSECTCTSLFISFLFPWHSSSSSQTQSLLWSGWEWCWGLLDFHSVAWTCPPDLHPATVQFCCLDRRDGYPTIHQPHTLLVFLLLSSPVLHCNTLLPHWKTWDGCLASYISLLHPLSPPLKPVPQIQFSKTKTNQTNKTKIVKFKPTT